MKHPIAKDLVAAALRAVLNDYHVDPETPERLSIRGEEEMIADRGLLNTEAPEWEAHHIVAHNTRHTARLLREELVKLELGGLLDARTAGKLAGLVDQLYPQGQEAAP